MVSQKVIRASDTKGYPTDPCPVKKKSEKIFLLDFLFLFSNNKRVLLPRESGQWEDLNEKTIQFRTI